ncbi:MAG: hypothetical protein V4735_00655 [Pseudomonadota bacterium]
MKKNCFLLFLMMAAVPQLGAFAKETNVSEVIPKQLTATCLAFYTAYADHYSASDPDRAAEFADYAKKSASVFLLSESAMVNNVPKEKTDALTSNEKRKVASALLDIAYKRSQERVQIWKDYLASAHDSITTKKIENQMAVCQNHRAMMDKYREELASEGMDVPNAAHEAK